MYVTNDKIKKYKLKLTVLSPTYIGNGNKYDRFNYIYNNGFCYVLIEHKWIDYLCKKGVFEQYLDIIKNKTETLNLYVHVIKHFNLDFNYIKKNLVFRCFPVDDNSKDFKLHDINEFIKNPYGNPYIPASSIKGYIISALQGKNYKGEYNLKMECVFKNMKYPEISISDSTETSVDNLFIRKKHDIVLVDNDAKDVYSKIPVYREYIKPQTEFEFELTIYPCNKDGNRTHGVITDISQIFEALKHKRDRMFDKDVGIFGLSKECEKYYPDELLEDENIIVLGGGAGFHSKSLISSICKDRNTAVKETKNILSSKFRNKKHHLDSPISPRGLKVCLNEKYYDFIGICKLEVVD